MPVGKSGRIVVEIDPEVKHQLYQSLGNDGSSLKQWFLDSVEKYLAGKEQLQLDLEPSPDGTKQGMQYEV